MKRQTIAQTQKENTFPPARGLLPHVAVRTVPEHEVAPNASLETRFGHDFSQATVRPSAPMVGRDHATAACPVFPRRCPFGGACHVCPARVQTKLAINEPGDKYEREADRVAGQVMRMPETQATQKTGGSGRARVPSNNLQRSATHQAAPSPLPSIVHDVLRSPGQPLDQVTRASLESRFSADFGMVRVHTNALAARSARAVGARAYTMGHNIVFDDGLYAPRTAEGRHLLAHELVHVLQQHPQILMDALPVTVAGEEALQRVANPYLVAALAVLAAVAACGLPFHQYAMRTYGHKTDKWRHCWVSCEMSKTCGLMLAELAGLGKEIRDRAVAAFCDYYPTSDICTGGHGDFWDSLEDLVANQFCIPWETFFVGPIARLWRQSCKDCCDASGL